MGVDKMEQFSPLGSPSGDGVREGHWDRSFCGSGILGCTLPSRSLATVEKGLFRAKNRVTYRGGRNDGAPFMCPGHGGAEETRSNGLDHG